MADDLKPQFNISDANNQIDYADQMIRLESSSFPPEYQKILELCVGFGFKNPELTGGALRDVYLGIPEKITDWDIMADYEGSHLSSENVFKTEKNFREAVLKIPGVTHLSDEISINHARKAFRLNFKYHGRDIDIAVFNAPRTGDEKIRELGDAPINSIRMNARGEVFVHPDFTDHAQKHVYAPLPHVSTQQAEERFLKLQKKIPDLSWPRENQPSLIYET